MRGQISELVAAQVETTATFALPPGIRLIKWKLKEPPVAIETCAVVTDSGSFARSTLEQLRIALSEPRRWVGWSLWQLVDRLAQVGVIVELDKEEEERLLNFRKGTWDSDVGKTATGRQP